MKVFVLQLLFSFFFASAMACPTAALIAAPEIPLGEILDHPKKYKDQPLTLTGQFFGWKGVCTDSILKTRSDWVLKSDERCLYVSGKMPPRSLSLTRPKGEKVSVTGYLKLLKKDLPVFEATSVQLLP